MAAERRFDPISVPVEGDASKRRRVHRINCGNCSNSFDVSANTQCGSRSHEDLIKIMRRGGWEIGRKPSQDRCPDCASAKRRNIDNKHPAQKVVEMPVSQPNTPVEPPRELGVDDALIIAEKLTEVYAGRDKGYGDGWSDKLVAEHLSVPRDWVRQVREKRFGPAGDSEEVRAVLAEARAVSGDAARLLKATAEKVDLVENNRVQMRRMLAEADKAIEDIDKGLRDQLAECQRTLARVEKSVAAIQKVVS